jgi:hypothetical protein
MREGAGFKKGVTSGFVLGVFHKLVGENSVEA